ncbi:hypothetical protein KBP51_06320 [Lactiplantibacillus pentosus]|uniref:hypothetical protein n=1 Tax=Lactiplantibacillus pentosus TaxID=1589 RepID=UPI001330005F|nr:hypothetical protein [Lactiplantibacillus pentosus]MBQ0836082.1 hypothetical protein [Lactiplantibacillus pentosus]MCB5223081.1 hypothetical protein [Lactiplantibacillus pentosus]
MGKHRYFKPSKKKGRRIDWTANTLVNFFHSRGIKVMRYNAFSTNSVYLKLDYGLLYSVRISDHRGKQHLQYRFNATDGYHGPGTAPTKWGWKREYYSLDSAELNQMCRSIIKLRAQTIEKLGPFGYQRAMEWRKRRNQNTKGFWQSAQDLN